MSNTSVLEAFTLATAEAWLAQTAPSLEALGFSVRILKTAQSAGLGHIARCSLKSADQPRRVHVEFYVYLTARASRAGEPMAYEVYLQVSVLSAAAYLIGVSTSAELGSLPVDLAGWRKKLEDDLFQPESVLAPQHIAALVDQQLTL